MPQFDFIASEADQEHILKSLFSIGGFSVIKENFLSRESAYLECTTDCIEFRKLFRINRGLLVKGSYTTSSLVLRQYRPGRYYINTTSGGPLLEMCLPVPEIIGGVQHFRYSSISHHSHYWDEAITKASLASDELKAAYKLLVVAFKKQLRRKSVPETVWVGLDAFQSIERGEAKLLVRGRWWP